MSDLLDDVIYVAVHVVLIVLAYLWFTSPVGHTVECDLLVWKVCS